WRRRRHAAAIHLLWLRELGSAAKPQGCLLLPDDAGFLRLHRESFWLRLQGFRTRNFPQKRFRLLAESKCKLGPIRSNFGRQNAGFNCTERSHDSGEVSHDGGTGTLLPERVLPQWL